ncbi:ATP-dependent DNA helicase RecG [soil metagenome]
MAQLGDKLDFIVGKKAADKLDVVFGIRTVNDLLRHYPRKYSKGATVLGEGAELPEAGTHVTFVDTIRKVDRRLVKGDPKRPYLVVTLAERNVTATFFNARYLSKTLVEGTRVMISGEVSYFREQMQLTHPAHLILDAPSGKFTGAKSLKALASTGEDGELDMSVFERDFFPIYAASAKIQSWDIYACVRQVLDVLEPIVDPFPESFIQQHNLLSEEAALRAIHLAESPEERDVAIDRLRFDEAVGMQWALVARRNSELGESGPPAPLQAGGLRDRLLGRLPFELTAGQVDVLAVISDELSATRPMNRMLQGEVGSGKTIVSVLAMLQMIDAGYQCALLAPTEVLAGQHARAIGEVLGPLGTAGELGGDDAGTRIALLTGSMSAARKRQVRDEVSAGTAGIVIGTHALLQDTVEFSSLGMVVVDEQHRFGVEQRDLLRAKAPAGLTPHLLVMTATPIPRTVALAVYGDLEFSTLRELPRGRQPIATTAVYIADKPRWLDRVWQRISEEVAAGRQAYVVASRIDADDKDDKEDKEDKDDKKSDNSGGDSRPRPRPIPVTTLFEHLRNVPLRGLRLGLMHGRLSGEEKDAVMGAFRAGEIDVLVSTTVIEVGVDVPNATVMVVMDADRFGISQLHQLRGRIGRGSHASVCLLVSQMSESSNAGRRLNAVASTQDGFELADIDLAERREGDVLGLNQSGLAIHLRFLSLLEHREIIEEARAFCDAVYPRLPDDQALAFLAAYFTNTDRIEFLDKS